MSNLSLWCEAVLADFYDKKLNDDPEYVIDKLHKDVNTCRERIAELEIALTDAHENIGFLAMHLHGRMGEGALLKMAEKADEWEALVDKGGDV